MVDRGTGRTSAQMREAPAGAIFIWCNGQLDYPCRLAHHLGRTDLEIFGLGMLDRPDRFFGRNSIHIVLDHAAVPSPRQRAMLAELETRCRVRRPPLEIVNLAVERINPPPVDLTAYAMQRIHDDIRDAFLYGVGPGYQETVAEAQIQNARRRRELAMRERQINPPLLEAPSNLTAREVEERFTVHTSLPRAAWCSFHVGNPDRAYAALDARPPLTLDQYAELMFSRGEPSNEATIKSRRLLRSWLTVKQRAELKRFGYFHVTGGTSKTRYRINRGRSMNIQVLDGKGDKPSHGICFVPAGSLPEGDVMLAQKLALELQEDEALAKANVFDLPGTGGLYGHPGPTIEDWRFVSRIATINTTEGGLSFRGIPIREVDQLTPEPQPVLRRRIEPAPTDNDLALLDLMGGIGF